jgi:thiamine biosynthesis lipoprotein
MKYLLILVLVCSLGSVDAQKHRYQEQKLGSYFTVIVSSSDTNNLYNSISEVFELVDELDHVFSDYKEDSECMKISREVSNEWINISQPMYEVLKEALFACKKSKGLFNVTIGKASKLWRYYKSMDKKIPTALMNEALSCVKCDNYRLKKNNTQLWKTRDCFEFDFGGIAKGYIIAKVSDLLTKRGFDRHLIDAGGDIKLGIAPFNEKGWKIKIEESEKIVIKENIAIATSGKTYQYNETEDVYNSHIIKPQKYSTGQTEQRDMTVFHKNAMRADWMATWLFLKNQDNNIKN